MIIRTFHQQFTFPIWRVILWSMRMMVQIYRLFEKQNIDAEVFYNFLAGYQDVLIAQFMQNKSIEDHMLREEMKADFAVFVGTAFLYFTDEERMFFTSAPYTFAETMAYLLQDCR